MRISFLSTILCLLFFTCEKEVIEEIPTEECSGVYALDVALPGISQPLLWLNDADDNVVFQDDFISPGATTYFLNTAVACEDHYTLSFKGSERVDLTGVGTTDRFLVQQIAQVEKSSGIRLAAIPEVFITSTLALARFDQIAFENSPQVDSVLFMGLAGERYVMEPQPPVSYIYKEEDQELRVYFNEFAVHNTNGLLAVRVAATGEWLGRGIDFAASATFVPFTVLEPLEYKTFAVNLPADVADYQLSVRWLKDDSSPSSVVLGDFEGDSSVSLFVPSGGNGFLVRTIVPGEVTYLNQQYFEQWPTEVNVTPRYFLQDARLSYPVVSIYADEGDVVFLENDYVTPGNNGIHWKRQYVAPFNPNSTSVRLVKASGFYYLGYNNSGWSYGSYVNSFENEMEVSVYHYPLLSGGYQGFLRDAFRISNNQEGWLRAQVYEAVKQRITD